MTEALSVVDSLRAASQLPILTNESSLTLNTTLTSTTDRKVLPLKMALFNLQKYIKEGDFAVELMLKGGLRLLIALVERVSGGLTGNSLAVSCRTWDVLMSVRTTGCSWSSRIRIQLGRSYRGLCRPSSPPASFRCSTECHPPRDRNRSKTRHFLTSFLGGYAQPKKSRTKDQAQK